MEKFEALDNRIDRLANTFSTTDPAKGVWKELWSEIRSISSDFKGVRYPTSAARAASWDKFQAIVSGIKEGQDQFFASKKSYTAQSSKHLERLTYLAKNADPDDGLGQALAEGIAFVASHGITFLLKKGLDALVGETDEEKQKLTSCSDALKEAFSYLSAHKQEMSGHDKQKAFQILQTAKSHLDDRWQNWKEKRQVIFDQRREEYEQRAAERIERQRERQEKHNAWRERQEAFIERLQEAEDKISSALSRRNEVLQRLEYQLAGARSSEHRSRIEGWIGEEQDRISAILEKLSNVREKLTEAKARL